MTDGDALRRMKRRLARLQPLSEQHTFAMDHQLFFENQSIPSRLLLPDVDTFVMSDLGNVLESLTESIAEQEEEIYRRAILGTDWSETAVLRVITFHPIPAVSSTADYEIEGREYDIERYDDRAPPASDHSDGDRRCSVATITWPLLQQLAEEHEEVTEIVDVALSPEEGDRVD